MNASVYQIAESIVFFTQPQSGCRGAYVRFPSALAIRAAQLPAFTHADTTYVPYTGTVVTPERAVQQDRPAGYYLEYRALRPSVPLPVS